MPRKPRSRPTTAEVAILNVLWERGPATVREVHEALEGDRGYTTTLKLMQLMVEKGLLRRDTAERSHRFMAAVTREATQRSLVSDLRERLFGGSAAKLVLRALSDQPATPEELAEIRRLIDAQERRVRGGGQ